MTNGKKDIYILTSLIIPMPNTKPTDLAILTNLRREGSMTLQELSQRLNMTRMGVYKHLAKLEGQGVISRRVVKGEVGRPYYVFFLTDKGKDYFMSSDSLILMDLLKFLQREDKEDVVSRFLRDRFRIKIAEYMEKTSGKGLEEQIGVLCELRNREGYMAEVRKTGDSFELLEYNCPIFKMASLFGEACDLERKLFHNVLKAEVENTHRQVDGQNVCRFLIRGKSNKIS